MRNSHAKFVTTGLLLAVLPATAAFAKPRPRNHTHASVKLGSGSKLHKSVHTSVAGISSERATEIQTALIKQGYLTGEPTGSWDAQTSAAMAKLQGDNGWQTRLTPDARALNKLGLGAGSPTSDEVATTK
jgi:peptidoglycan hydrolase-like protein with peptidoglycan-binding domain